MSKINFQNLPNTTTPLNASNLNSIQEKEQACFKNTNIITNATSGSNIPLTTSIYNTTSGKVTANNNGKFTINYSGYIKVSFNIWIHCGDYTARPWIKLRKNSSTVTDLINDVSSGYASFVLSDCIISVTSGDTIEINCATANSQQFDVDSGVGNTTSYITIELL